MMDTAWLDQLTAFDQELIKSLADSNTMHDVFNDIATNRQDHAFARAMEERTLDYMPEPAVQQPFIYSVNSVWPIVREHWHRTRYSDGTRYPVWYGNADITTTIYETLHHWVRFVMNSYPENRDNVSGERTLYQVHCRAELVDLCGRDDGHHPGTETMLPSEIRHLGMLAQARGRLGLLALSPYRANGLQAAIFRQSTLRNPRSLSAIRYHWDRVSNEITIEHPGGERYDHLDASTLLG